jgi:hypothetical protein
MIDETVVDGWPIASPTFGTTLLTTEEEFYRSNVFDIDLLARRLLGVCSVSARCRSVGPRSASVD